MPRKGDHRRNRFSTLCGRRYIVWPDMYRKRMKLDSIDEELCLLLPRDKHIPTIRSIEQDKAKKYERLKLEEYASTAPIKTSEVEEEPTDEAEEDEVEEVKKAASKKKKGQLSFLVSRIGRCMRSLLVGMIELHVNAWDPETNVPYY